MKKKIKEINPLGNRFAPRDRISTNSPINMRTGNYMLPRHYNSKTKDFDEEDIYVDQLNDVDNILKHKTKKFKIGDRVILPANEEEGWLEERGEVIEVENKDMYIVQIDNVYLRDSEDDGIREVHISDIKPEIDLKHKRIYEKNKNMKNRKFLNNNTTIKPERMDKRELDVKPTELDVDMFQNISRDLQRLTDVSGSLLNDIRTNNAKNYDAFVLKLKRSFEPLAVTIQRVPDSKSDLGKQGEPESEEKSDTQFPEEPKPEPIKNNIAGHGNTELDKEIKNQDDEEPSDSNAKLKETKASSYVDKIALKNKHGRIVWVKRKHAPKYIAKGYTTVSGAVPRSKRKRKSARPRKSFKKARFSESREINELYHGGDEIYQGSGTHLIMPQDKHELMDDKQQEKRVIMKGTNNKTYAVRASKTQKYLDQGWRLERDATTQQPKVLKTNENTINLKKPKNFLETKKCPKCHSKLEITTQKDKRHKMYKCPTCYFAYETKLKIDESIIKKIVDKELIALKRSGEI